MSVCTSHPASSHRPLDSLPESVKLSDSTEWRRGGGDQMSCRPNTSAPKRRAPGARKVQGALAGSPSCNRARPESAAVGAASPHTERGAPRAPGNRQLLPRAVANWDPATGRGASRSRGSRRSLRRQTRRAPPASALGQVSPPASSQKQGTVGQGSGVPRAPAGSRKALSSPGHQVNIR